MSGAHHCRQARDTMDFRSIAAPFARGFKQPKVGNIYVFKAPKQVFLAYLDPKGLLGGYGFWLPPASTASSKDACLDTVLLMLPWECFPGLLCSPLCLRVADFE